MNSNYILILILVLVLVSCAVIVIIQTKRTRKTLDDMDKMLDEAIKGDFEISTYTESQLSKLEAKLNQFLNSSKLKKGQMEQEQEKISGLISDISHQTKTPIANILMYSQLLNEDESLSEASKSMATQIESSAEKLNFLIQALIKTSRLETGAIKIHVKSNEVSPMLQNTIKACLPKAEEKKISLSYASHDATYALFDEKWVSEAIYNILDNAVKYTEPDGSIQISSAAYEMFIRIDIMDTGIGIMEEDLPKIFSRFWRAHEVASIEGVGIGLYLSREIISACGGYIKVFSKPGKGSVFSVFLPKA